MKPIIPTLREKKRYVVIEAIPQTDKPINIAAVAEELLRAVRHMQGTVSLAKARIRFIAKKSSKNRAIIRVERTYVNALRAAICAVQEVGSVPVMLRTVIVSGSIQKASQHSS